MGIMCIYANNTVDGSEIRRSPVEVGSLSHYLQGFMESTISLRLRLVLGLKLMEMNNLW